MALISIDQAARQIGVSPQTIEAWAEEDLLTISAGRGQGFLNTKYVEEDEVYHLAEGLGWLHVSAEEWDGAEE
jgi:hypothetical protein